ncbi:MAG: hypothetical protein ACD_31C00063G0001, partial [uncultured bacterium]
MRFGLGKLLAQINNFFLDLGEIHDTQNGFKFFTNKTAKELFRNLEISRWLFDIEIIKKAKVTGLKIVRLPVVWEDVAESKVGLGKDFLSVAGELMVIYLNFFSFKMFLVLFLFCLTVVLAPFVVRPDWLVLRNGDFSDLIWPDYYFVKDSIVNLHQIPFWNPTLFSGIPEINPQSMLLYPPNWISFLLPLNFSLVFLIFLHVLIAGILMYLFSNKILKLPPLASTVMVFIFCFSPFLWGKFAVGHLILGFSLLLISGVLFFGGVFYKKPDFKSFLFTAIFFSLIYLNHPGIWYYAVLFSMAALVVLWFKEGSG